MDDGIVFLDVFLNILLVEGIARNPIDLIQGCARTWIDSSTRNTRNLISLVDESLANLTSNVAKKGNGNI